MKSVPIADEALIHEMMRRAPVSPERAPTQPVHKRTANPYDLNALARARAKR